MSSEWENILNQLGYEPSSGWSYRRNEHAVPYQGFKLHISSTPEEAPMIVKRMAPFLNELGCYHKCYPSKAAMMRSNSDRQRKKLFTIYPTLSNPETSHYSDGTIKLKRGDKNFNRGSMFANANKFEEIAQTVFNALEQAGLGGKGPKIEDERRYKDSRLHFRYSAIKPLRALIETQKGQEIRFVSNLKGEKRRRALEEIGINLTNSVLASKIEGESEKLEHFMDKDINGDYVNTPIFGESGTIEGDSYHPPNNAMEAGKNYL